MARNTRTVLVVEQEAALRALLLQALATDGYHVLATGDGKDAVRVGARHENEIAVLVTDVILPGFDGGHLAELLTLDSPQLKVLYLDSGSASRTDIERHSHALAWDTTIIPLREEDWARTLSRAVRDALRRIEDQPDHTVLNL